MRKLQTLPSPHLTEEARNESLPDVDVVVSTGELCTGTTKTEAVHDPGQLVSNTVGQLDRPVADEVVVAPLGVFVVWESVGEVREGRGGGGVMKEIEGEGEREEKEAEEMGMGWELGCFDHKEEERRKKRKGGRESKRGSHHGIK